MDRVRSGHLDKTSEIFSLWDLLGIPSVDVKLSGSVTYSIYNLVLLLNAPGGSFCNWLLAKFLQRNKFTKN